MDVPTDLTRWRKDQRAALLARRLSAPADERAAWNRAIADHLERGFPLLARMVVGVTWPYKAEFDARPLARRLLSRGARVAMPAVAGKGQPLQFRQWWPGARMEAGALDIPVPKGTPVLVPDAVLVPPVGFDEHGARLGYGAGYFDRTLATLSPPPLKIGVAFELSRVPTIHPQPHDIPMDFIVTEERIYAVEDALRPLAAELCAERAERLAAERGLPRRQASP